MAPNAFTFQCSLRCPPETPRHCCPADRRGNDARLHLAAVVWVEWELQLAQALAAPALALLQRAANGERTMRARDLREAEAMVATLLDVRQQTGRRREAVRQMRPAAAAD